MMIDRRAIMALGAIAAAAAVAPALAARPNRRLSPADRLAIETVLMRYVWGIDTLDPAAAEAVFSRDARIHDLDGKVWRRSNGGAGAFVRGQTDAGAPGVQTHLQINRIASAGRGFRIESYWSQVTWKAGAPRPELLATGAFVDSVVERAGEWRIAEKRISLWDSATVRVPVVPEPAT